MKYKYITILIALIFFVSCGNKQNYAKISSIIKNDDCTSALAEVAKTKETYGKTSEILFLLDSAMVNSQCGNFDESNNFFHNAEELAENLYTESVTKGALSFVTNDLTIPYSGEDFERVLINLFSAFSYIELGEKDEALVECRRLNTLLTLYNTKYEDKKNAYKEDALARYISGILYEEEGSYDDAYIDYKKAYKTFIDYNKFYGTRPPSFLKKDLYRMAYAVGRVDEFKTLLNKADKKKILKEHNHKKNGRIVFIHLNGLAPVKKEKVFSIPTPKVGTINIAFPEYEIKGSLCPKSDFLIKNKNKTIKVKTELVENIDEIALRSLQDRKGRIWAKTVARAITKQIAINAVSKSASDDNSISSLVSFGLNIANNAFLEKADTRSWRSIPSKIYMAREFVAPGTYNILIPNCSNNYKIKKISIKKGETKYIISYTMF